MAVYYQQKSSGFNPLPIVGTLLQFVPGMQGVGAALGAAGAAMNGDWGGAAKQAGGMIGNKSTPSNTGQNFPTGLNDNSWMTDPKQLWKNYNGGM